MTGDIQMFVKHAIERVSAKRKESVEAGSHTNDFAVIRLSGVYAPLHIKDIPSVVFGRESDQYALTSIQDRMATFMDTTMVPCMYATISKKWWEDQAAVYVILPFSQPAVPADVFLDVYSIGEKIIRYAHKVNPDYPIAVADYIPGFLKLQKEVNEAEQNAIRVARSKI